MAAHADGIVSSNLKLREQLGNCASIFQTEAIVTTMCADIVLEATMLKNISGSKVLYRNWVDSPPISIIKKI